MLGQPTKKLKTSDTDISSVSSADPSSREATPPQTPTISQADPSPASSDQQMIDSSPEALGINRHQNRPSIIARVNSITGQVSFNIETSSRPKTNVEERLPNEKGDGDHVTPYSVFIDIIYAAVEDEDIKDIPHIIKETSKIFLKKDRPDSQQDQKYDEFKTNLEQLRKERKQISRSLYRLSSSRPENGYMDSIKDDEVMHHPHRVGIALDEITKLQDSIIMSVRVREKNYLAQFVADSVQEFISDLNLEENVSFSKSRVRAKRDAKAKDLDDNIKKYQIDGQNIVTSSKVTSDNIQTVKNHIISKENQSPEDKQLLQDTLYHDRVKGEGARVSMALKGLRAFNQLVKAQDQITKIENNQDLDESKKREQKGLIIEDLYNNQEVRQGLKGSKKNPLFAIDDIDTIINEDKTNLNINQQQWQEMSKVCGNLFARLFDYEMVDYKDQEKQDEDLARFYLLSTNDTPPIY